MQQTTICDLWNSGMFQICTNCHGNQGVSVDHTSLRTLHDSFVNVAGNRTSTSPANPQGSYLYAKMLVHFPRWRKYASRWTVLQPRRPCAPAALDQQRQPRSVSALGV